MQFDVGISAVQPPGKCFQSGDGDGFVAISATSSGHMAMLGTTNGFHFQYEISYECSIVTIAIKCNTVELWAWDR